MRSIAPLCSAHRLAARGSDISRWLSSSWKHQRDADQYANRAIAEGLRSRAAYKLEEIDGKFGRFLRQGANVVDLGAAPGGFSLLASRRIGVNEASDNWNSLSSAEEKLYPPVLNRTLSGEQRRRRFGLLICVDKQEMEPVPGALFVRGDFLSTTTQDRIARALRGEEADIVLSDMAPSTTGDPGRDHDIIMYLAEGAMMLALRLLRNGGVFVCKIFSGSGEEQFRSNLREHFVKVKSFRPKATRKRSREIYYVATGYVPQHLREGVPSKHPTMDSGLVDTLVDDLRQLGRRNPEMRASHAKPSS